MAHITFSKLFKASRTLLVAAIAVALLSNPFLSDAEPQNNTYASVLMTHSSIAGLSSQVELKGDPLTLLELSITKPNGKELILQAITDDEGRASLSIDSAHISLAGDYLVSVRHLGKDEGFSNEEPFEVYAGTVSDTKSSISVSKNTVMAGETLELTVALKDSLMNPLSGHVVKMISSDAYVDVYSPEFATDQNGEIRFYALANSQGDDYLAEFAVIDTSSNTTLRARPKVAVIGNNTNADQGGFSNLFSSVVLSSEAGPLDHFSIELVGEDDATVEVGDQLNVSVSALDENNLTVSDYTGTIRFSSTDGSATLPNDYTFLAEDAGSHDFSLSVKLVTPGTQTVSVNDTDQYTIDGDFEIEVVTDENSDAEYDSDFVDDDFDRDGDFTLISPASGSYSEDNIEIQGSAQYGYSAIIYLDDEEAGRTEVEFDNSFSYQVSNLDDGKYDIYVEIVELGDGAEGEEEILEVLETSDLEEVNIDTTAPEIVSIKSNPDGDLETESEVEITILSEGDLENVSIVFNDEVYELTETSTSGKYTITIPMPSDEGLYGLDVVLTDALGNDVQYRDQMTLNVLDSVSTEEATDEDTTEDSEGDFEDETVAEGAVDQVIGVTTTADEETILISWETPESDTPIAYYEVHYGPSSDALFASSETFDSSTTWKITNLPAEEVYYFAVTAIDVDGNKGLQSDAVIGIPVALEKDTTSSEDRPEFEEQTKLTVLPPKTPETGAGTGILLAISGLGAAAFTRRK
ncbi:MAG: hypothetical protein ACI9QC_000491 [Oceanicoccus sp.]|jgi:hypothetical protein